DRMGKRRGYRHELPDQLASFAPIVKWSARVDRLEELPDMLAQAWRQSLTPPSGPTYLEIPVDLLTGTAASEIELPLAGKIPSPLAGAGPSAHASGALVPGERLRRSGQGGGSFNEAIKLLAEAKPPVIWP